MGDDVEAVRGLETGADIHQVFQLVGEDNVIITFRGHELGPVSFFFQVQTAVSSHLVAHKVLELGQEAVEVARLHLELALVEQLAHGRLDDADAHQVLGQLALVQQHEGAQRLVQHRPPLLLDAGDQCLLQPLHQVDSHPLDALLDKPKSVTESPGRRLLPWPWLHE